MKNNKGFSLVELIIVIAIMAILVGVMAPNLIKYIEKSKVSSDSTLASTVQSAILTAASTDVVVNSKSASSAVKSLSNAYKDLSDFVSDGTEFGTAVKEILGCTAAADVENRLKSDGASKISVSLGKTTCEVSLPGTDSTGEKNGSPNIIVK